MQLRKRLSVMILAFILLYAVSFTASAHEAPDLNQHGSIAIIMQQDETVVPGGTLTLYRVGEIKEDDGNYSFSLTGDFIDSGRSLEDIESLDLAKALAEYARGQKLTGFTQKIDEKGRVSFDNLELGLYLLVQNEAANGYNEISPFLVSIPMNEDGVYLYKVDASPKVELEKKPDTTTSTQNTTGTTSTNTKLPQTGQLNWPIPVLVVSGLVLFSVGWVLRSSKKRDDYEK